MEALTVCDGRVLFSEAKLLLPSDGTCGVQYFAMV